MRIRFFNQGAKIFFANFIILFLLINFLLINFINIIIKILYTFINSFDTYTFNNIPLIYAFKRLTFIVRKQIVSQYRINKSIDINTYQIV